MNIKQKIIIGLTSISVVGLFNSSSLNINTIEQDNKLSSANIEEKSTNIVETTQKVSKKKDLNIVYDGLTLTELSNKLEKSLNSTLSGKGKLFASYSLDLGLDPYLAVAIVLQETGCKWDCSQLVKQCNNVGGIKGAPGCWGGSYKAFSTLDEGIKGYLDNLYYNYYSKGLTTPELINPIYAESKTWASKVNYYISEIKKY